MGFFGKKKGDEDPGKAASGQVGAHAITPSDNKNDDLPVAVPIEAKVAAAPAGTVAPYTKTHQFPDKQQQLAEPFVQGVGEQQQRYPFRRHPMIMPSCPVCQKSNARTRIRTWPNVFTWISVLVLLILFWPLCWIPLVCDVYKQTDHFCTNCGTQVGKVDAFQDCCEKTRG